MSNNDQLIALAGMFQAGSLVRQAAREGRVDSDAFEASLGSILKLDAATTEAVYGGVGGVRAGLRILQSLFDPSTKQRDLEIARYVVAIVALEKKLSRDSKRLQSLGEGIDRAKRQCEMFPVTHTNIVAALANIYAETISTLEPRVMVNGEQGHLNNPENANRVRAALLALMRAAVLWRQKGGKRWHLIFSRNRIVKEAKQLLLSAN